MNAAIGGAAQSVYLMQAIGSSDREKSIVRQEKTPAPGALARGFRLSVRHAVQGGYLTGVWDNRGEPDSSRFVKSE